MLLATALSRLPARRLVQGRKRPMASLPVAGCAAGGYSEQVVPIRSLCMDTIAARSRLYLLPFLHGDHSPKHVTRHYPLLAKRPPDAQVFLIQRFHG